MTVQEDHMERQSRKWTVYLVLCCFTVCLGSFQFGYNIGSLNLLSPHIKDFYGRAYFDDNYDLISRLQYDASVDPDHLLNYKSANEIDQLVDSLTNKTKSIDLSNSNSNKETSDFFLCREHHQKNINQRNRTSLFTGFMNQAVKELFFNDENQYKANLLSWWKSNKSKSNKQTSSDQSAVIEELCGKPDKLLDFVVVTAEKIRKAKKQFDSHTKFLFTLTNTLFVVGGMLGALTSKKALDKFGRKNGILFHHGFTMIGCGLVFASPYLARPEFVMVARFLYGLQGGMSCGLVPTYLNEVSPKHLRGATGVVHQLFITIGILIAQMAGFRQIFGTGMLWHFGLGAHIIPALLGFFALLFFFPETPRALLIDQKDEQAARIALIRLRSSPHVSAEIDSIVNESLININPDEENSGGSSGEPIGLIDIFKIKELRWPLWTGLIMQMTQQLCGINAVFFYSEAIFREANVSEMNIQYAVVATGAINVILTIVCVPLIDRLGRKPLLVYPMGVMIVDFVCLTISLKMGWSLASMVCIIVFIMCFAIGLGPIPFIYVAECFKQDARSAALSVAMFVNWSCNTLISMTFLYIQDFFQDNVFLVFAVWVTLALVFIAKKVPETKGRTVEEIMQEFRGDNNNNNHHLNHQNQNNNNKDNFLMKNTNSEI